MADNYTTPITNPVIPQSSDQEAINWLANWLNNRRKQLRANADNTSYQPNYIGKSVKNDLGSISPRNWNLAGIFRGIGRDRLYTNKLYYAQLNNAASARETKIRSFANSGEYNIGKHTVAYNPEAPWYDSSTKVHERTHAMRPFPQENTIAKIISTDRHNNSTVYPSHLQYLKKPSEIYARLNAFRFKYKLAPNQIIDQNFLNSHRDELRKEDLEIFDDDTLIRLFNEVADVGNQNISINDNLYARKGTKLISKKSKFK